MAADTRQHGQVREREEEQQRVVEREPGGLSDDQLYRAADSGRWDAVDPGSAQRLASRIGNANFTALVQRTRGETAGQATEAATETAGAAVSGAGTPGVVFGDRPFRPVPATAATVSRIAEEAPPPDRTDDNARNGELAPAMYTPSAEVQRLEDVQRLKMPWSKKPKQVDGQAMARLQVAEAAISYTKQVLDFGAGNQIRDKLRTNNSSSNRTYLVHSNQFWDIHPNVRDLAASNPSAFLAAKSEYVRAGNCQDQAAVALHFLQQQYAGLPIARVVNWDVKHSFVIIGYVHTDKDEDLVVCDPWPIKPTACLWPDHFGFMKDRKKLQVTEAWIADGNSAKNIILAGLRLNEQGQRIADYKASKAETKKAIKDAPDGSLWDQVHPGRGGGRAPTYELRQGRHRR